MHRQPVSSSNIASIGYDPSTRTLEVEFNRGSVYRYLGVPEGTYRALMSAASHGSYLNSFVKGVYSCVQVA